MGRILHRSVQLVAQQTQFLCWEACARMTYLWKNSSQVQLYEQRVSAHVALGRGLSRSEMGYLYCKILGLAYHPEPSQVIGRSPLIWSTLYKEGGHAMLLIGWDDKHGFINYDPGMAVSFNEAASITSKGENAGSGQAQMAGNIRFVSAKKWASDSAGGVWGFVK